MCEGGKHFLNYILERSTRPKNLVDYVHRGNLISGYKMYFLFQRKFAMKNTSELK